MGFLAWGLLIHESAGLPFYHRSSSSLSAALGPLQSICAFVRLKALLQCLHCLLCIGDSVVAARLTKCRPCRFELFGRRSFAKLIAFWPKPFGHVLEGPLQQPFDVTPGVLRLHARSAGPEVAAHEFREQQPVALFLFAPTGEGIVVRVGNDGGSTITQQIVKNLLVGDDLTYERKIREMIVASRVETTRCRTRTPCRTAPPPIASTMVEPCRSMVEPCSYQI